MRKRPFNTNWKSPSQGVIEKEALPQKILDYYNRMKIYNEPITITIGT